jgi:hypothetical protein
VKIHVNFSIIKIQNNTSKSQLPHHEMWHTKYKIQLCTILLSVHLRIYQPLSKNHPCDKNQIKENADYTSHSGWWNKHEKWENSLKVEMLATLGGVCPIPKFADG